MRVHRIVLVGIGGLGVSQVVLVADSLHGALIGGSGSPDGDARVVGGGILCAVGAVGAGEKQSDWIKPWVLADVIAVRARGEIAHSVLPALEANIVEVVLKPTCF